MNAPQPPTNASKLSKHLQGITSDANLVSPRAISLLAYIQLSFPITYIITVGLLYNLPLAKILHLFFTFIYFAHSAFAVFVGWALLKMKPYAWHIFLFHAILIMVEQFYIASVHAENYNVEISLIFSWLVTLSLVWLVKTELRVPYFSPRIAWWESDPRYKITVPTQMTTTDHFFEGDIMDISSSGCFIKTTAPLLADQIIHVKFSLFDKKFHCAGKVMWKAESGVTHPKGIGVKFFGLNKKEQLELKNTVKKLKNLSGKYQKMRREEKIHTIEQKVEALLSQKKS